MIAVTPQPQIYTVMHRMPDPRHIELTVIAVTEGGNRAPVGQTVVVPVDEDRTEAAARLIADHVGGECFDMELLRAGRRGDDGASRVRFGLVSPEPRLKPRAPGEKPPATVKRDRRLR